jgi:hypothetical protein
MSQFRRYTMALVAALAVLGLAGAAHAASLTTSKFEGVKANTGTATFSKQGGMRTLTLSDDFTIPDAPAPHWQVVDSNGNVYLLQRLQVKGDVFHKSITLPSYVMDVSKVQIWCAWAEVLLGEASFEKPVK